ncbi:MAG: DEAD/DEAH box helicase [Acidimicrobiia bacterium]|nr:DEAD/DEAH box helicase [Acidimicrobiia bacterium]MYC43958.1 DEAD/DEAH box helicase [Acidimicrobiia bacterium]MYI20349.1 DEAD/DEAH box helicase [Acidimicrobiia bacterium]
MDQALNSNVLASALDRTANLPSPEQLRTMLANAEVAAFFRSGHEVGDQLLETAWNLHHVGTVRPQLAIYEPTRQVQANAVAAHIFDLALQTDDQDPSRQLVHTFAGQVSAIRGDRTPNATAMGRRLPSPSATLAAEPGRASLELGCALLTLDRSATVTLLRSLSAQAQAIQRASPDMELLNTGLASAVGVIEGVRLLQEYLAYGGSRSLDEARQVLIRAATNPESPRDLDSRWVAAHLVDLCDDLGRCSIWAILPGDTPTGVGMAMTLGDPPVMTLWPPQVELLKDAANSPLRIDVRRAVLTFPTNAGKTLLAQLLVVQHLSVADTSVCFVAPSHSLCRETREGMDRRLWTLRRRIVEGGPLGDSLRTYADVVIMTPEKLASRLRADEQALLDEFGLFVFDEAHLVGDDTRGWSFETTVSRLHSLTADTDHRILLLSAALGGTASVQTWLGTEGSETTTTNTWRGPRRLHATYTYWEDGASTVEHPPTGRQRVPRTVTDLYGIVNLYVDEGRAIASREAKIGHVTATRRGGPRRPSRSEQLLPIVGLAAKSGSVLVVHATKRAAERLAEEIARARPETAATRAIVQLAEQRMGASHNLAAALRRGVAYHHAALPADVQAEIEDAVRQGEIDIICATSTLTEGVNLPVRTVIISERGYYDSTEYRTLIDSAGLMNAAGRAGRAGRETEGWVVVNFERGAPHPRQALRELDQRPEIHSTLSVESALEQLGEYEALVHVTAALVLQNVPATVDGFLAYCWYLAELADVLSPDDRRDRVIAGIRKTLAWHQMPPAVQGRWEAIASHVVASYEEAPPVQRRRWARSGAPLSANVKLEAVAADAAAAIDALGPAALDDPVELIAAILKDGRLDLLLSLVDPRDFRFKRRRSGPIEAIGVNLLALILDWVRGAPLKDLADIHLTAVQGGDEDAFRFEQLSTFLTRICEHHLPFSLGTVLEWINDDRSDDVNPRLPAHLHYGVPDAESLELLMSGVRSRRIAAVVGARAAVHGVPADGLRRWLARMGPVLWRAEFDAGPTEVADLLYFVHDPAAAIGASLLDGHVRIVGFDATGITWEDAELPVVIANGDERPRPLVLINDGGQIVGRIRASEHRHLAVLVDAGFALLATPATRDNDGTVTSIQVRIQFD